MIHILNEMSIFATHTGCYTFNWWLL